MFIKRTSKCSICRRAGQKLFLKGEKCFTQKCPFVRKSYPPGVFGQARRRRGLVSEYKEVLRTKQGLKFFYGMGERQFKNYVKKAIKKSGAENTSYLLGLLERRLDNIVFRLGFASSRSAARQLVSHGHILVNSRVVDIPSFLVKLGDRIEIRKQSLEKAVFQNINLSVKKQAAPSWINFNQEKKSGEITAFPNPEEAGLQFNLNKIIELYSK